MFKAYSLGLLTLTLLNFRGLKFKAMTGTVETIMCTWRAG